MAARADSAGGKPAPKPDKKPAPKPDNKPAAQATSAGAYAGVEALASSGSAPASSSPTEAPPPPQATPQAQAAAVDPTTAQIADVGAGSDQQQEIDVLRGQVQLLNDAGVWTAKNPPKFTGNYGRMLQGLLAGEQLRNAFATLNKAAASVRDSTATSLALVKNHKTPTFTVKKG